MRIPVINGVIDRRILVNFALDPEATRRLLPAPFRPKLVGGRAMGGICLIRLRAVKPRFAPGLFGLTSENAAHRIAVEWEQNGERREGVYIPRRDSDSWLNHLVGGRVFPGEHSLARFTVTEGADEFAVALQSRDGDTRVSVAGRVTQEFPEGSVFASLAEASAFFEGGALGYSNTRRPGVFDGLELRTFDWRVEALALSAVASSFFEDRALFGEGAAEFDHALLMRDIAHEWHGLEDLCAS